MLTSNMAAAKAAGAAASPAAPAYSTPDQPARFAAQKAADNSRALRIEEHFQPGRLAGARVLVTGANRGLGLALVREAVACGARVVATCRKPSPELQAAGCAQIVEGIDVAVDASMGKLVAEVGDPLDVVINNAGYFMKEKETVLGGTMDFADEMKTIDICAVGPLRVTNALWHGGKIQSPGGKIIFITSQGGSVGWRDVQCPDGGDYGHHMSKAAANMGAKLVANELRGKAMVGILHPGFNKTGMTSKYSHIWEVEGAVDPAVGAKRVLHETNVLTHETSGRFVNCEDGLEIPW